jgi:lysophospholipase L1-like esterase
VKESNTMKGKNIILDHTNDRSRMYADACVSVGRRYRIPVVNTWEGMSGHNSTKDKYLSDGVHLNVR